MTNLVSTSKAATQQLDRDKANPVLLALMVVGIFIKLALSDVMLSTDGSTGPASSLIWGYGIVVFSMLGLIIVNVSPGSNEWNDVKSLPWVLLMTMVLMLWLIGMSIQYFKEINLRNVPNEYFMWSNYSTILLIALLGISIYQFMLTALGVKEKANELAIYGGIVFVFNLVAITIQQIILNCFYVDG
jgi:hypothetical protein